MTTPHYTDDTVTLYHGDALALPLDNDTVDLVVTSPPYFGLRSYQDGGQHYAGQIGDEATPAEFVDALIAATREMVRVLKPSGSIWINLGDKYAQAEERSRNGNGNRVAIDNFVSGSVLREPTVTLGRKDNGVPRKSLIGIPWRYAIRCIDDLGLILRAEIIWSKPNGLPESVTDRVRRSHETWFHFTKQPRYYSAVDAIREPYSGDRALSRRVKHPGEGKHSQRAAWTVDNPLGALPGSVWTIPTQPLTVPPALGIDHFAAFPMEWPRRIIQGWSPPGICTACGEGRRPVTLNTPAVITASPRRAAALAAGSGSGRTTPSGTQVSAAARVITGYACACPDTTAPTIPAVVLDPFGGTGTAALMAKVLGRHGVYVDLSEDYCRLAMWRCTDPGELARAMQVDKPAVQVDGQSSLLDFLHDGGES